MKVRFDFLELARNIKVWGQELGFQQVGITDTGLATDEEYLKDWLAKNFHGEMSYMARHGIKRSRPEELVPGTLRIISARMDYLTEVADAASVLADQELGYIARYALGRDYHKVLRSRLRQLALKIQDSVGHYGYRVFTDSGPVLEKALARNAGLGWIGKHTNLINRHAGSWFLLGEVFTDLPLPPDEANNKNLCGSCTACIDICPTQAIIGPQQLDARRCISYLTIEYKGSIPEPLRKLIGNRIFGCDDCQLVCPWNRYARLSSEIDFQPRNQLDRASLLSLFAWTAEDFDRKTEGSALRRIGYTSWQRNIAVALGNAPPSPAIISALLERTSGSDGVVGEHIGWALEAQRLGLTATA